MSDFALSQVEHRRPKPSEPVHTQERLRVLKPFIRKTRLFNAATAAPRGISGTCLDPYLRAGDCVWIDPSIAPRDGDLILVMLTYVIEREHIAFGPRGEEVIPDRVARRESLKLLRIIDGVRWLVTLNDGAVRLDDMEGAEIIGTVTAWHRWRWWRRPSMRKLRKIGEELT
jgi:hypothetical protein